MMTADIVILRAVDGLDRFFTYWVPPTLEPVEIGYEVRVPLGSGSALGLVVGVSECNDVSQLKPVTSRVSNEPIITPLLLAMARYMEQQYLCYLPQALRAMMPAAVRNNVRATPVLRTLVAVGSRPKRAGKRQTIWDEIATVSEMSEIDIYKKWPGTRSLINQMRHAGQLEPKEVKRDSIVLGPELNEEQAIALEALFTETPPNRTWLLEGVTGSGKTEVYLQWIQSVLAKGRQALVLVPEISLTPQTVMRFEERFGSRVRVWHSNLSDGDRVRTWQEVRHGDVDVIVGARSAIFLPFRHLGAIVLDEEHETTYKQDEHPRYHTRDMAQWRAQNEDAVVVLGSATPSLETAYAARNGEFGWLRLGKRALSRPMPSVSIVDMREELRRGHKEMFSRLLKERISEALDNGQQIILFLNRRGYSTFVLCRDCGKAVECPNCSVALTYHRDSGQLTCHYCSYITVPPTLCLGCQSPRIRYFGAGTEKIAEEVSRLWPSARIRRVDRDAVATREGHSQVYREFLGGGADVLVGTQMIAKGMDFPKVSVVGIVAADVGLHLPDFRANERTFQLLVQAAGRSGRGDVLGEVVIQTYSPDHYAISLAQQHDFDGFYELELQYRQQLQYPPCGRIWLIEIRGEQEERVSKRAQEVYEQVAQYVGDSVQILGPAPAPLAKVRLRYRYHILLKSDGDVSALNTVLKEAIGHQRDVSITADPYFML